MLMIFPTAEVVVALQMDLADYRRRFNNPILEDRNAVASARELTEEECFTIIYAMVDDAMNNYLLWVPQHSGSPQTDAAMKRLFPLWNDGDHASYTSHLLSNLLDEHTLRVEEWVSFAMKSPTWNVWSLHRLDRDVVFEKGEDYRILDWTRRMESGEWSDTAYRPHAIDDDTRRTEKEMFRQIIRQERATADHILRLHGLPGIEKLDEQGVVVLRMILGGEQNRRDASPAQQTPHQRRYVTRSIAPRVIEIFDMPVKDKLAANPDLPPQPTFVESQSKNDTAAKKQKRDKRS